MVMNTEHKPSWELHCKHFLSRSVWSDDLRGPALGVLALGRASEEDDPGLQLPGGVVASAVQESVGGAPLPGAGVQGHAVPRTLVLAPTQQEAV